MKQEKKAPAKTGLMTTDDAGAYLDVQPSTLTTWRSAGKGPAYLKLGGLVRYRLSDLDAFIEESLRRNTHSDA